MSLRTLWLDETGDALPLLRAMMAADVGAQLDAVLHAYGILTTEPKRRLIHALLRADELHAEPTAVAHATMRVFRDELREAQALRDVRVFKGILGLASTLYGLHHRAQEWRLPSDFVLMLMKQMTPDLQCAYALLSYAIDVDLHWEQEGEVGEHLFSKFFQACEAAGPAGLRVAEEQFDRMTALQLPVKQITIGRLMAVCRAAGDGEAAKRVHRSLHLHGVQFSHHSLTQYISTFLRLEDAAYLQHVLEGCEDPTSGMSEKLNRDSYQRLLDVRTSRECQQLLRAHMERVGVISGGWQPEELAPRRAGRSGLLPDQCLSLGPQPLGSGMRLNT